MVAKRFCRRRERWDRVNGNDDGTAMWKGGPKGRRGRGLGWGRNYVMWTAWRKNARRCVCEWVSGEVFGEVTELGNAVEDVVVEER